MNAIEVRDLVKRYRGGTADAVGGVSFDVPYGEFFCLLGPNGAGKTTVVSILTTTLIPSGGQARIAGHDLATRQSLVRRNIGIVFQQPSLDLNLTAEENIRLHAVLYGRYPWRPLYRMMPAAYRRQVSDLAAVLGLTGVLHRRTRILSGGMRRRLEIARALTHRPRVLFLDEPTVGLDPDSRRAVWSYLEQVRRQDGTTIFLTTHYLQEAESAGAVCVLAGGRVVERGRPADLKARHTRPELVLDARDRDALRRELLRLGLPVRSGPASDVPPSDGPASDGAVSGDPVSGGPATPGTSADGAGAPDGGAVGDGAALRVPLDGRSAQDIVRSLESELTRLHIAQPTLEDAYLRLIGHAARTGADR
ncbi:ABC transporter ATP-binding protein [Rugosimonospora africana]|uniref:ABC transporter ATP-binding protein n=1 Tax=Rugosimonospora africana TaxID=556532 RepID=UPI001942D5FD|nr:ATP-binding cassette domain-containing protein [Rugosimonospora africana]